MKRRTLLAGTSLGIATSLGGCLETIDGANGSEDEGTPTTACETGRAIIEAIGDGDYERAAGYAPHQFDENVDGKRIRSRYSELARPDAINGIECTDRTTNDDLANGVSETFDAEVTDAQTVEYSLDVAVGSDDLQSTTQVLAVQVEDEWYAWLDAELIPRPDAVVTVETDGMDSATVMYNSGPDAVDVYVTGGQIDDPTAYRLEDVGEMITVRRADVGSGTFSVVATYGSSDAGGRSKVNQFELTSLDEWRSVDEIVLEGATAGWNGVEPAHIAGSTNPTLVLEAGREYRIGWKEGDGATHNLEIRDANDEVIDDYETELTADPGEEQFLTITATEEMTMYRCNPHVSMEGPIEVVESI